MDSLDSKSVRLTATGTVKAGRGRITGIYAITTASAGSLIFRDGGASGTIVLQIDTPANNNQIIDISLESRRILCSTDIHCTVTNVASAVVFYDG